MASSSTPTTPTPKQPLPSNLHTLFNCSTHTHIAHLNRILSTASGVDSTLLLTSYTLTLLSSLLSKLLALHLRILSKHFALNASKVLLPGETVIATIPTPTRVRRLSDLQAGLKTLATASSDVRAFMRLWGLLGIYSWARSSYYDGPKDDMLRVVRWAQVVVNALYLIFENPVYLAGKGVLKGGKWSVERKTKWWCWSARFFAGHVVLDYVRLWRVRMLRLEREEKERAGEGLEGEKEEKEEKIKREREVAMWWKELLVNVCYTPLVVHWSTPGGTLSDTWVGALGMGPGVLGFREVWRATA